MAGIYDSRKFRSNKKVNKGLRGFKKKYQKRFGHKYKFNNRGRAKFSGRVHAL